MVILLLTNLVKSFFFLKSFFRIAFIGFSTLRLRVFSIKGYTKNLKQAADDIGFPGKPNIIFFFYFCKQNWFSWSYHDTFKIM